MLLSLKYDHEEISQEKIDHSRVVNLLTKCLIGRTILTVRLKSGVAFATF